MRFDPDFRKQWKDNLLKIDSQWKHNVNLALVEFSEDFSLTKAKRRANYRKWVERLADLDENSPLGYAVFIELECGSEDRVESVRIRARLLKRAIDEWDKGKEYISKQDDEFGPTRRRKK